ncbi:hypothetical protein [Candidatus Magnetominusculus dajiuhuensis]|uniref:hypothetical protein n=1 Tax=Candidatus Magnetominusculus dajiuhuensis TaxID=3137712 RepID=UPI001A0FC926|nr:hypothetical protein [Nitrospirota bacterium]
MSEKDNSKITVTVEPQYKDRVAKFLNSRNRDVAEMKEEIGKGDYPSVKMTGGMIKKAAAAIGLTTFKEMGEAIETAANLKDSAKMKILIEELADYLARVEIV